jgi:hypothetical protein
MNDFGAANSDDRCGKRDLLGIADTARRRLRARLNDRSV